MYRNSGRPADLRVRQRDQRGIRDAAFHFIKGISGLFDSKETRKSAKRIRDSQKNASDTPFERSHSRKKADRFGHSHEFDTYQTISGDGSRKCVWFVDFAQGNKNIDKITKKSWRDRMRRKKKKAAK